jgi:serine/threonine protein kinase
MSVAQLKAGALFAGRFRIERVIGRGGMGTVYEVVLEATGERHALKVLAPQLVSEPKHRARFAKEASISAEIRSAHIVPVLDAGVDEQTDTPWLLMELLRGESLAAFVRTHGKLDAKRAGDILGQVAEALTAAHAAGVIHRDLKPDNVFIVRGPDGSLDVRVLDFGIAKLASETVGRTTGALGSPLWMAPEEARKEPLTPAVDVWAFGLLAFYVLAGCELWRSAESGSNIAQALNEVLLQPIPNPILRAHAAGAMLPGGFDAWFAGCVVRDVSLRFQSVGDAWTQLESVLRSPPMPNPVPTSPASLASPSPLPEATKKRLVIAGSVALAVGVFALVVTSVGATGGPVAGAGSAIVTPPPSAPATGDSVLFAPPPVAPAPAVLDAGDLVLAAVTACLAKNDIACAHAALEPVVSGEAPAAYHVQLLYDLCELEADTECLARVAKQHPKVDRRKQRERTLSVPSLASPPPPVAGASVAARARALATTDPAAARALLEPRVFGRKATDEEAQMLYGLCKAQRDATCKSTIKDHYPNVH